MIQKNKKVLIICPWFSLNGVVGSFFREQAEVLSEEYEPIFVQFQINGMRESLRKKNLNWLTFEKTKENRKLYTLHYSSSRFLSKKKNQGLLLSGIRFLIKKLERDGNSISLIHSHSIINVGHWACLINEVTGIPYITTEHNQVCFKDLSNETVQKIEKTIKNAKYNLAISSDKIRQFAANWLFPKFTFVGNLINPIFQFKEKDLTKQFKIITIGAFTPIKDHTTMFKALEVLDKRLNESIIFEWIGCNGWEKNQEVKALTFLSKFKLKNIEVVLTPYLEREEIVPKLQESNLFLFSSISEGMPVSVLESLACGTPVVSTNCGGVDQVINQNNGFIVPVGAYRQLSEKAFLVYETKKTIDYKNISREIISNFGVEAFKKKMLVIYNSCT